MTTIPDPNDAEVEGSVDIEEDPPDIADLLKEWTNVSNATAHLTLRNNRTLFWLKISLAAISFLLVSVIFLFVLYHNTTEQVVTSRCEAGNDYRKADRELWDFVLHDLLSSPQSPQGKASTLEFEAFLDKKNKLLKC